MSAARLAELERALAVLRRRIGDSARAAGRDPAEVTLVAVSKTWPASDVLLAHQLGVADFAENYEREAAGKAAALAAAGCRPQWHFVGQLQRNKCRSLATYADLVHSLDRPEVARALGAAATRAGRVVGGLVQVAYAPAPGRGGVSPERAADLADEIAGTPGLELRGVMTVATPDRPARPDFAALHALAERLRQRHPGALVISAGMTGDLEDAVAEGATHLRVGTALFGVRPPPVG